MSTLCHNFGELLFYFHIWKSWISQFLRSYFPHPSLVSSSIIMKASFIKNLHQLVVFWIDCVRVQQHHRSLLEGFTKTQVSTLAVREKLKLMSYILDYDSREVIAFSVANFVVSITDPLLGLIVACIHVDWYIMVSHWPIS